MTYLLDTNVVSAFARAAREVLVVARLNAIPWSLTHMSILSLGELRFGIRRMPVGVNRDRLDHWLESTFVPKLANRMLPIDEAVCDAWADLRVAAGRTLPVTDSLIAATAIAHDMVLVTRNVRDFQGVPVRLWNPWDTPTPPS